MAEPNKNPETQAPQQPNYGLYIIGKMNGVREFTSKKTGQVFRNLLVAVPGMASVLQVAIPTNFDVSRYPLFSDVKFPIVQTEFDGKFTGYRLA